MNTAPDTTVYARRRKALAQALRPGSIALIPTAKEQVRNRDSHFPFRADSYFYYLTGFTEPESCLLIDSEGHSTLFCLSKNIEREIWDGYRLGPDAAAAALQLDHALPIEELEQKIPELLANHDTFYYPFATHPGLETQVQRWLGVIKGRSRLGQLAPTNLADACTVLDAMRLIKDASEIATMRQAATISAQAHCRAMRYCAQRLRSGQATFEYHLEAELLHEFRHHGSEAPAYNSIVAAGANACVLHYRADRAPVRAGELVLIDAGCELHGYASDITRTFPADGRFTGPQRALYDIVLAAQQAAIACTQAGQAFNAPHEAALRILTQGMLDTGLLDKNTVGNVDDAIASKAYLPYYMHRTSHWLGMDVHDCGSYQAPNLLRPGMVLTIEPGLYVRADSGAPTAYHHIGIRIEDDILVGADGQKSENLSQAAPVHADDIEALMRA